ncbi:MAG: hypothetical protein NT069_32435, partial [Planctomycetota bacterium]|nr:hypothetical protein [Planctomycetota bacterium]
ANFGGWPVLSLQGSLPPLVAQMHHSQSLRHQSGPPLPGIPTRWKIGGFRRQTPTRCKSAINNAGTQE